MSQILYEHKPAPGKLEVMHVFDWPIWEKEISTFPWSYDQQEVCYFIEGQVIVTTDYGTVVELNEGDLVTFPAGLSCTWEIKQPVKKHYKLG